VGHKGSQQLRWGAGKDVAQLGRGDVPPKMSTIVIERALFKIGEGGVAITLPKAWVRYHKLAPGDRVQLVVALRGHIRVRPGHKASRQ
jgi:hypothetical protein